MQIHLRSTRPLARLAFVVLFAFAAAPVASPAFAQDGAIATAGPAGLWRITGTTPDGIEYVSDLDLAVSAENAVTGTVTLPRMGMNGTVAGTFEPTKGMLQVTLRFPAGDGEMAIPAELTLDGDAIRGDGEGMEGATIAFTGRRVTAEMLAAEAAAAEAALAANEAALAEVTAASASVSRTPLTDALKNANAAVLEFNEHVTVLSSPWMEGRLPGTRGMELAREYMEWQFIKAGLVPAIPVEGSDAKSFRQPFPLGSNDVVSNQRLEAMVEDAAMAFTLGEDYEFTGMGTAGEVEAPVVFVGYSIEEGENGYTSFREDEDLSGKIALMLRFEPMDDEGGSQWSERGWSSNASFQRKFAAVSRRNPWAVILVNPPGASDPRASELIKRGTRTAEFPVVMMTPEAADRMVRLIDADERSLMDLRRLADAGEPSFDFIEHARVTLGDADRFDAGHRGERGRPAARPRRARERVHRDRRPPRPPRLRRLRFAARCRQPASWRRRQRVRIGGRDDARQEPEGSLRRAAARDAAAVDPLHRLRRGGERAERRAATTCAIRSRRSAITP